MAQTAAQGLESNRHRIERNAALLREFVTGGALLDVGCGGGAFLLRIGSQFQAKGIEVDPRHLALARSRGLAVSDRPIETVAEREAFDAVTLWDVIEHVNDPALVANKAHALLKSGGVLLMDTPSRDGFFYRFGQFTAWLTRGRWATTMGMQYSPFPYCHKQIFRKRDVLRLLAGFREVTITERFELSFPIDYYLEKLIPARRLRAIARPIATLALRLLPIRNKLIVVAVK